jgi:beta-N-acetylhexosaminidase
MSTVESLALRCLMPGFEGLDAPAWVVNRTAAGMGGVVIFARNIESQEQLSELTAALHRARPQLIVAIDEEGGDVTRLGARTGSSYPGNLALGFVGDLTLTKNVARAMGEDLAACGIDLNLAPVADVDSNPDNPIIGVRSFGADAAAVAQHTAAWVEGMQAAGVAACAKHFPGHGAASVDSHVGLPVIEDEELSLAALEPFDLAIASGVRAIMSAHIVDRTVDEVPATISRRVMTGLLRERLNFDGLAITDGLEMRAITDGLGIGEGAVRALAAGCDALVIGGDLAGEEVVEEIVGSIVGAVKHGRLPKRRLAEAARRVDALFSRRPRRSNEHPGREIGLDAARRAVWREGAVAVGDEAAVLRFEAPPSIAAGTVPWGLAAPLASQGVHVTAIDVDPAAHDLDVLVGRSGGKGLVLVVRDLHRRPAQVELIERLLARRPDAVLVEMGVPRCRPAAAKAYLATHGSARVCGEAAAEVLRR